MANTKITDLTDGGAAASGDELPINRGGLDRKLIVGDNWTFNDAKGILDANGNEQLIFQQTAAAVNFLELTNAVTGDPLTIAAAGDDTDIQIYFVAKATANTGEAVYRFRNDVSGKTRATVETANTSIDISAEDVVYGGFKRGLINLGGGDSTYTLDLVSEAGGSINLAPGFNNSLVVSTVASPVNYLTVSNAATGTAPTLSSAGSDASVELSFAAKGAGGFNFIVDDASLTLTDTTSTNDGPDLTFMSTATGVNGDAIGWFNYYADNNLGVNGVFATQAVIMDDATSGSVDTHFEWTTMVANSRDVRLIVGNGVSIGTTDLAPGVGNLGFADAKGIFDGAGNEQLIFQQTASATNYLEVTNSATTNPVSLSAAGTDLNVGMDFNAKGTGSFRYTATGDRATVTAKRLDTHGGGEVVGAFNFIGKDSVGADQQYAEFHAFVSDDTAASEDATLNFRAVGGGALETVFSAIGTASATNYLTISNAATGTPPIIAAAGGDTNIDVEFDAKGEGAFTFLTPGGATTNNNVGGLAVVARSTGIVANSFGIDYTHILENASGTDVTAYRLLTSWTDATAASEDSVAAFSIKSAGADLTVLTLGGADVWTDYSHVFDMGNNGDASIQVQSSSAAAGGPGIIFYHNSASPAANDYMGWFEAWGNDSAAAAQRYGLSRWKIIDSTAGSLDSKYEIYSAVAGTITLGAIVSNGVSIGSTDFAPGAGNLGMADDSIINIGSNAFPTINIMGTSAGNGGPLLGIYHNSASPAANDNSAIVFYDNNSLAVKTQMAAIDYHVLDATSGSEDGRITLSTKVAGSDVSGLRVSDGVIIGNDTVFPGAGGLALDNGQDRQTFNVGNGSVYSGVVLNSFSTAGGLYVTDVYKSDGTTNVAYLRARIDDGTAASEDVSWRFGAIIAGAMAEQMRVGNGVYIGAPGTMPGIGNLTASASIRAHGATVIPAGGTAGAGFTFSSTTNFGVFFGSGAPSLSAAKGSLYLRSDGSSTSTRAYINTDGGTTWTNLTTAA